MYAIHHTALLSAITSLVFAHLEIGGETPRRQQELLLDGNGDGAFTKPFFGLKQGNSMRKRRLQYYVNIYLYQYVLYLSI